MPPTTRATWRSTARRRRRSWCSPPTRRSRRRTGLYVQRALEAAGAGRRCRGRASSTAAGSIWPPRGPTRCGPGHTHAEPPGAGEASPLIWPRADASGCRSAPTSTCRRCREYWACRCGWRPNRCEASSDEAALVPADRRHPMLRRLTGSASALSRLPIERYRRVLDEQGWDVLARFAGGAMALAERRVGEGVLVLFTSDLDNRWNRFPAGAELRALRRRDGPLPHRRPRSRDRPSRCPTCPRACRHARGRIGGHRHRRAGTVIVNVNARRERTRRRCRGEPSWPVCRAAADRPAGARRRGAGAGERQRLWQIGLLVMLGAAGRWRASSGRGRRRHPSRRNRKVG